MRTAWSSARARGGCGYRKTRKERGKEERRRSSPRLKPGVSAPPNLDDRDIFVAVSAVTMWVTGYRAVGAVAYVEPYQGRWRRKFFAAAGPAEMKLTVENALGWIGEH